MNSERRQMMRAANMIVVVGLVGGLTSSTALADGVVYRGRPISAWVEDLGDLDPRMQLKALNALAKTKEAAIPELERASKSTSKRQRVMAVTALGLLGEQARGALERGLANADPDVRVWSGVYLAAHGLITRESANIIAEAAGRCTPEVRPYGLLALAQASEKPAGLVAHVAPLLGADDVDTRHASALLLGTTASEVQSAGPALLRRLDSETSPIVRSQIVDSLGRLRYRGAKDALESLRHTSPEPLRVNIDKALESFK